LNSARFLGKERGMGSADEGKIADLVPLSADPLAN
jgi:imidazolonepropionase-like amidohydrolase